ncbi:phosphonate metabolism protein/1,5-bisphosphokinase (PRPP-forming) PhnN [Allorhizobium sp. BGMRC 0089]|uniref:phosphonate metabolism protein/1,5-bisphosphokinase (PRPP-forming) PhnN n=1 Tax=Allorhizobium sonneratiae TaxID=2934936 RepID=UPI00203353CF|nr:phosphonate metabolism protein/1,5-bisphosphokinase (PRPP-forming) PhnN [Allorhizobium sonneratiae]MCM2291641.1 phosphonate metabolism protein/1,5-bisphosphokinase (PRPP-forming) PhnN [Allorhizobium sonneratiae]
MAASTCEPSGESVQKGCLIAVVGPSGAGKDSLIAYARHYFAGRGDVHFAQRTITRPADAGGEDHHAVNLTTFAALKQAGHFAVDWQAHGLCYGLPQEICHWLAKGHVVIANGSRSVLPRFRETFANLLVVNVTARSEVLADRLEARGRESREDILKRLARGSLEINGDYQVVTLDNSGALEDAGRQFVTVIETCLA